MFVHWLCARYKLYLRLRFYDYDRCDDGLPCGRLHRIQWCAHMSTVLTKTISLGLGSVFLPFLPRDATHKCGLCSHAVFLRPSVCPSICHVHLFCQKLINISSKNFHHRDSRAILVFPHLMLLPLRTIAGKALRFLWCLLPLTHYEIFLVNGDNGIAVKCTVWQHSALWYRAR